MRPRTSGGVVSAVVLELKNVQTRFPVRKGFLIERTVGEVKAVDGVSLTLREGEILGLVGESGCGKSTLARTIMQLIRPQEGTVVLGGRNLCKLSRGELRRVRPEMQMIFQDPYASLNPRMTVFAAIAEPMLAHGLVSRRELAKEVGAIMERVGLAPRFMRKYPHEFSGGQRQRIAIARTLALRPKLIIADEPVSALDVSVQAQILNLIAGLCREGNLSMIFISHDLAVVRYLADNIAVMYLGKIVEYGNAEAVFENPSHPYTQALIDAIPLPDANYVLTPGLVKGEPPSPLNPPTGCAFHPRCPLADESCAAETPLLEKRSTERSVACFKIS